LGERLFARVFFQDPDAAIEVTIEEQPSPCGYHEERPCDKKDRNPPPPPNRPQRFWRKIPVCISQHAGDVKQPANVNLFAGGEPATSDEAAILRDEKAKMIV
jgi:hypothetical protein